MYTYSFRHFVSRSPVSLTPSPALRTTRAEKEREIPAPHTFLIALKPPPLHPYPIPVPEEALTYHPRRAPPTDPPMPGAPPRTTDTVVVSLPRSVSSPVALPSSSPAHHRHVLHISRPNPIHTPNMYTPAYPNGFHVATSVPKTRGSGIMETQNRQRLSS